MTVPWTTCRRPFLRPRSTAPFLLIHGRDDTVVPIEQSRVMVEALRRGDQVLTQGGIIGKVTKVQEDGSIEVEIAENVKVKILRHTIVQVMNKTEPAAA